MKIASISYTNTKPFFYEWPKEPFELIEGSPKELAEAAGRGEVLAGPLPLTECWNLEETFEPLENWGIAVKEESRSVFLLSRVPLPHLKNKRIGVTHESSTSVRLLQVLSSQKHGAVNRYKIGFQDDDDAWLVIGDQALKFWRQSSPQWACVTDLASEWWTWKKLPFVFARWIVRKDMEKADRQILTTQIKTSLSKGLTCLKAIAEEQSKKLSIPAPSLKMYLEGFRYELGEEEKKSMRLFKTMVAKLDEVKGVPVA